MADIRETHLNVALGPTLFALMLIAILGYMIVGSVERKEAQSAACVAAGGYPLVTDSIFRVCLSDDQVIKDF